MSKLTCFQFLVIASMTCFETSAALAYAAHEHGVAKVDIAFDGQKGVIHFESPSASIYGFEHEAKTAQDKKTRDTKIDVFKTKMAEMVVFDEKAGCTVAPTKIEPFVKEEDEHHDNNEAKTTSKNKKENHHHEAHEGTHSEVHGEFSVTCKNSVAGTQVKFAFQRYFPAIKKITVQAINGEKQNGATIQNDKGAVGI